MGQEIQAEGYREDPRGRVLPDAEREVPMRGFDLVVFKLINKGVSAFCPPVY